MCLIPITRWPFVLDAHEEDLGGAKISITVILTKLYAYDVGEYNDELTC